ncbi:MAG TPA: hypothetical protein VLG44_02425 [Chlamydiales bacterium]|nr:hypothetical protein [Chlamydiales bacterium]
MSVIGSIDELDDTMVVIPYGGQSPIPFKEDFRITENAMKVGEVIPHLPNVSLMTAGDLSSHEIDVIRRDTDQILADAGRHIAENPLSAAEQNQMHQVVTRVENVERRLWNFKPRQSYSAALAHAIEQYAHVFEESTRQRDQKIHELKASLPKDSDNLSNSILGKRWWDVALQFAKGGTYIARSFVQETSGLNGFLKAAGEGGVLDGTRSFIDSGYDASQTIIQGNKSIKETTWNGLINANNSPDQALTSLQQLIDRITQIEERLGI